MLILRMTISTAVSGVSIGKISKIESISLSYCSRPIFLHFDSSLFCATSDISVVRNALKLLFEMLVGLICALVCAVYWE